VPQHPPRGQPLTTRQVAEQLGIGDRRLRRLFERGAVPEPARLGQARLLYPADVARVERYLRQHLGAED
jgi:excisionase family DNA binding protein